MEKIKRFITCLVPVYSCNFSCNYCYLAVRGKRYSRGVFPLVASPKEITDALSKDRLGGVCYFNLCAEGETLLHPSIVELICCIVRQGHYVDVVTNGVLSAKIDELIDRTSNEEKSRIFIKFSFHYLELKKRGLMDVFVDNVNKIKESRISYTVEITPCDELIESIQEIKDFSIKAFGALPHVTVARDESTRKIKLLTSLDYDDYYKTWSTFQSELFEFKYKLFGNRRREFCYAGDWTLYLDLSTGDYFQCYKGDRLGNIMCVEKPMNFRAIGRCREPHCFNGHAFLAFGAIPELATTTYSAERNRHCEGYQWLSSSVDSFFSSYLYETNHEYLNNEKKQILVKEFFFSKITFIKKIVFYIIRKLKNKFGK